MITETQFQEMELRKTLRETFIEAVADANIAVASDILTRLRKEQQALIVAINHSENALREVTKSQKSCKISVHKHTFVLAAAGAARRVTEWTPEQVDKLLEARKDIAHYDRDPFDCNTLEGDNREFGLLDSILNGRKDTFTTSALACMIFDYFERSCDELFERYNELHKLYVQAIKKNAESDESKSTDDAKQEVN